MKLFIVESPTKIKTISKITKSLGDSFSFVATLGHIKELPFKSLGVDLENFEPKLVLLSQKRALIKELSLLMKRVREVYLATDPDREGEAISFHLYELLKDSQTSLHFYRIDLQEITALGVKRALKTPRQIDMDLYISWKARRVLDRLVGYLLSPYLSKNFRRALSAGRVQSPALRLIVEREEEIETFTPKKRYSLKVKVVDSSCREYDLELYHKKELFKSEDKEELINFYKKYLQNESLWIENIETKKLKEYPPFPLKTSTLIEASGKQLGLTPKETMKLAQSLYEKGHITYMRTDSVRVSPLAKKNARSYLEKVFGKEYLGKDRVSKKSAFVQDAHECIRPTDITREPYGLSSKERALYQLIWQTFLASLMSPAEFEEKRYLFSGEKMPPSYYLVIREKRMIFDGFLRLLPKEKRSSELSEPPSGETYKVITYRIEEHETKPPERYTPQSLIMKMESLGIGRPSTYANMLDILFAREYITKEGKYLKPTNLGREVVSFLKKRASPFIDYQFTAKMEEALDEISQRKREYVSFLKEIYNTLKAHTTP
ncbi:MAG: type I DNA topoisomerase [Caldimicrobium sp.]|nr:type I DNA topoisomerase [Caldimicrobium sp.]MCX7612931.1 type I DNA topoisomerase [Caldimicrobium sp.]MDW8182102.1 type I DNA topoisomerase [Caldimicrobium sp.]